MDVDCDTVFLESDSVQPQFYAISNTFDYIANTSELKTLLESFTDDWQELQHNSWQKFWAQEGYEILQQDWHKKHPTYANELHMSEEYIEAWQALWKAHVLDVCNKQWTFFESVFYNYHNKLKKSLANVIRASAFESTADEEEDDDETNAKLDEINQELNQLKLFGLPVAFGKSVHGKRGAVCHKDVLTDYEKDLAEEESVLSSSSLTSSSSSSTSSNNDMDTNEPGSSGSLHVVQNKTIAKQRRAKNRKLRRLPAYMREDKTMLKYWRKRFSLFARFDEGIRLDRESWFSVSPEKVAHHLAVRLACDIVVDGFCGCGGNTIQFAKTCRKVIAIDIDAEKLAMAKHNARIYGVAHKIEFILGDFLQICANGRLKADAVFLSPPWGGPQYKRKINYDIESFLQPVGATQLIELARNVSTNVAFFLPRNSNMQQVIKLAGVGNKCEVEHNYLDTRLVAITAFYGEQIIV